MLLSPSPDSFNLKEDLVIDKSNLEYSLGASSFLQKNITVTKEQVYQKPFLHVIVTSQEGDNGQFGTNMIDSNAFVSLIDKRKPFTLRNSSSMIGDNNPAGLPHNSLKKKEEEDNQALKDYLRTKVYVYLVHDTNNYQVEEMKMIRKSKYIRELKEYLPIVDVSQFWVLKRDLMDLSQVDDPNEELRVQINFDTQWVQKYIMTTQLTESFKLYEEMGIEIADFDEFKVILTDTNFYLLCATGIVSLLHSVFELLAFQQDYKFWKNKKNFAGISARQIFTNLFIDVYALFPLNLSPRSFRFLC